MRLLVVEDDRLLGDGLCEGLRAAGYAVDWVCDGVAAEAAMAAGAFAAVVLDLLRLGRTLVLRLRPPAAPPDPSRRAFLGLVS